MRKLLLLGILSVSSFIVLAQQPWRTGEMEVRVHFLEPGDAERFAALGFNSDIYRASALAYLVPSEFKTLKNAGFSYEIIKPDLNAWSSSFGDALVPPGYYTFSQIKTIADSLATHFPSICRKEVFGFTAEMQELAALKNSDNTAVDENEPEIMFDGGIHGDEVGASQNVIQFARDLCLGYGIDPQITGLIDTREIWLFYCVNPWGRDFMTRYNSSSVDINRDNGYMWGQEGGSPGPFSQLETKALRKIQLENQFVSYTNYHSGTEIISYPWSYRLSPCPDEPSIENLAAVYASASGYDNLPYGQGSIMMYLIQGSTKDFNYGSLGSVAWSMEISLEKQPTQVQYYYNINKPAMLALIEHVGYGVQGTVTDAITGKPVAAAIYIGANYPCYSDPVIGDYHRYLIPGTYSLRFVANGYVPKTIDFVTVNDLQCTTVDVELDPIASQYGYRVLASRIPAFNAQNPGDEGYTAACLGPPDQVYYSLGRGGYIIIDMTDTILDGPPGTFDIVVYEGDASPEGYTLYAGPTMDGPWINIGFGTGTMSFDMQPYGVSESRYFMILDDNNGQANVNDAGFDFDAIACLHPPVPDTVAHISGYVYDAFTQEPIAGVAVFSGDSLVYTDVTGYYSIDLMRGTADLCAATEGYRQECDTLTLMAGTQYQNDFQLIPNVGIQGTNVTEHFAIVSPNPFADSFALEVYLPEAGNCLAELYDLSGKKVSTLYDKYCEKGKLTLLKKNDESHLTNLLPGCYILILKTCNSQLRIKVLKSL